MSSFNNDPSDSAILLILSQMYADIDGLADQVSSDLTAAVAAGALSGQQISDGLSQVAALRTAAQEIAATGMAETLAGAEAQVAQLELGTKQLKATLAQIQAVEQQIQFFAIWIPAVVGIVTSLQTGNVAGAFGSFQGALNAWQQVLHPTSPSTGSSSGSGSSTPKPAPAGAVVSPAGSPANLESTPSQVSYTFNIYCGVGPSGISVPAPPANTHGPTPLPVIRFVGNPSSSTHTASARGETVSRARTRRASSKDIVFPHVCVDVDLKHYVHPDARQRMVRSLIENRNNDPTQPGSFERDLLSAYTENPEGVSSAHTGAIAYMALLTGNLWQPGRTLSVGFLNGSEIQQSRVLQHAREWEQYANIHFVASGSDQGEIRISFGPDPGSWSLIGTDALSAQNNQATMNFGWLYDQTDDTEYNRTVVHEFGHALGCIHEHQSPAGGINWNKPAVYAYYEGPPNNWTPDEVDANLFTKYAADVTNYTQVDPLSIMMYPIPAGFTTDGFTVGWNTDLSPTDKAFIAKNYPVSA